MAESFTCPICGYPELAEAPRVDGAGSYENCPSCGFEFGYHDDDQGYGDSAWRDRWIAGGMQWHSRSVPQQDQWDPVAHLRSLTRLP